MYLSTSLRPFFFAEYPRKPIANLETFPSVDFGDLCENIRQLCQKIGRSSGVHSHTAMLAAGFQYINDGDTAHCYICELEISRWTSDMNPFTIHKQRSPICPFVLSMMPLPQMITDSALYNEELPYKRLKVDTAVTASPLYILVELDSLKQARKRTFSHWPHGSSPSAFQMIQAGFFNCNVGDRIICIYCNIVCQQWTPNSDDPCEVHKTLSPKCPYVIAMLTASKTLSTSIINEASTNVDVAPSQVIVHTTACNPVYIEIPKRTASFATWPNENLPPVDNLVKAGFFFTGTKTIVTCFYCNGSLQNWGVNDNPMIEHARWFPHCAYAKQLCGADLHQKIQESKRAQQERARLNDVENPSTVDADNASSGRLLIPDESTLSRLVAARLDLSISQSLLDRNFKLSIIKRCWEDQLRLKHEDFVSDADLLLACIILQKQIEHIDGKKDNITVPSVTMKRIRDQEQAEIHSCELALAASSSANSSHVNDVEMITLSAESIANNLSNLDICRRCQSKDWYPALLPCVHVRALFLHEHSLSS